MIKQDDLPIDQQIADLKRNNHKRKDKKLGHFTQLINEFKVATPRP